MIQALKNNLLLIVTGIVLAFASVTATLAMPALTHAAADIQNSVCSGANDLEVTTTPNAASCKTSASGTAGGLNKLITQVINIFSVVVGVVAVIMIIWGGFRYITSGGDSNNVGSAKNTILYAIVGLIIVALAQVIVKFVLGASAGV